MDFIQKHMGDMNNERRKFEGMLNALNRQVDEMDTKIRAYLGDRNANPNPRHLDLIEKIRNFRIPGQISNKTLENQLDSIQWKIFYAQKAWKQMWANAEAAQRANRNAAAKTAAPASIVDTQTEETSEKSQYSVNTLWEIQKEKLRTYGTTDSAETKPEFKQRLANEYEQLNHEKKADQEIVMLFDIDQKKCRLIIKD
jgi:hypothetical protein